MVGLEDDLTASLLGQTVTFQGAHLLAVKLREGTIIKGILAAPPQSYPHQE